ncbi:MAG: hypothetical protein GY750_01510 [Lentisphaerae bacterium]|nr:hypothetical protein [Lentisphaerota bacterium]MCP4100097.1 hypothetical protein [Lentisphaerota bacterium]
MRSAQYKFNMTLPEAPYSYEGINSELHWAIEALEVPGKARDAKDFVLSSYDEIIILEKLP